MKTKYALQLTLLISLTLLGAGCESKPTEAEAKIGKHLFILSGQSNMVGMKPEISFTPAVTKEFGAENILIVKDASSGQSIRSWCKLNKEFPPPTTGRVPKVRGELYTRLMNKVNAAIKEETIQSVTFVWMQGESDLRNSAYHIYLPDLLAQLQKDMKRKRINVVIGRISDCGLDQKKRLAGKLYIRKTQVAFAESLLYGAWVDTDGMNDKKKNGKIIHDLHYTPEGYRMLGQRFAEEAIKLIRK